MSIFGMGRQPGQARYDGAVHNLSITESVLGTTLPILIGTQRLHAKLLDYYGFNAQKQSAPSGKGIFGSKGDYWEYYATIVAALAQGPCVSLLNIWTDSGQLVNLSNTVTYTVPPGGGSITPKNQPFITEPVANFIIPILGAVYEVGYVVSTNDYGGVPKTLTGTQTVPLIQIPYVPLTQPGAGEFMFDSASGTYYFGPASAGLVVSITYAGLYSLYYFIQTQFDLIPSSAPFHITPDNQAYFYQDMGVTFIDTNTAGVPVNVTPTASGEYQVVPGTSGGWIGGYVFYPGDEIRPVAIKYSYTSQDSNITSSSVLNFTLFNGAQSQNPWSYSESANPSHAFGYTGICYVASENLDLGQSAQMPPYNYEVVGQAICPGQQDANPCDAISLILTDPMCGIDFPIGALDIAGTWANARAYWNANGFFISDILEASSGISDIIKGWCDAGNTAGFFSGGLLKLVPYGEVSAVGNGSTYTPPTNPVAVLTWDDILLPSGQKPGATLSDDFITIDEVAAADKYNYVQCNWNDRLNSYNNDLINQQNDAAIGLYGRRMESAQGWKFICLRNAAQWALACRLLRNLYIDKTFKFALPYTFDYLEPMDVLVLPTGISVRTTKVEEDEDQIQAIEAENFLYGASSASIYPTQSASRYQPTQAAADPGSTYPAFIQNTSQQVGGVLYRLTVMAAGVSKNWGGCQIWVSMDGVNYSLAGTINEICSIGILSAALPEVNDPDTTAASLTHGGTSGYSTANSIPTTTSGGGTGLRLNIAAAGGIVTAGSVDSASPGTGYAVGDKVYPTQSGSSGNCYFTITQIGSILSVDMSPSGAELIGTTQAAADQFGTLAAIVSPDGNNCEFISYENCELTAANRFNLSYLRRGVDSTTPTAFPKGSTFSYIGSAPQFQYQYTASKIGVPIFVKLPAFNLTGQAIQPLSQCKAYELFLNIQGSQPIGGKYSPSAWADSGSNPTVNPTAAYDGNVLTAASGSLTSSGAFAVLTIACTWSGFPSFVTNGSQKLYISYSLNSSMSGAASALASLFTPFGNIRTNGSGTATFSIPSGTNINTITVAAEAVTEDSDGNLCSAEFKVFEIWIE